MKINLLRSSVLRSSIPAIAAVFLAIPGYAAAQQNAPQTMQLVSANAMLANSVDSKNATQGEMIRAKLTSDVKTPDAVNLPKGTMLMGKVEKVQMSNNNGPATLSLVFDQARLSNGQTIPIKATLLAAYPANTGSYYADTGTNGSLMAGQPHLIQPDEKIDQEAGTLNHVSMHSAVQSQASAVFMSKDRNINLKRGTMLQIAIAPSALG